MMELEKVLRELTIDLREVDLPVFRKWIELQYVRWERDPVFVQRVVIRKLRQLNPHLRALEANHRAAIAADSAGIHFVRLQELENELSKSSRAIGGLTNALRTSPIDRQANLLAKLDRFINARQALETELNKFAESIEERRRLLHTTRELNDFRTTIGLEREEIKLGEIQTAHGKRSDHRGKEFERTAEQIVRTRLIPDPSDQSLRLLHNVRLGAARVEFDLVLVRLSKQLHHPVDVLAVVEAKRNINDLAHGFLRRQEDLLWMTGNRDRYIAETFRTQSFPTGHFDHEVEHREGAEVFRFGPSSFSQFRVCSQTGWIYDDLFIVTRPGWVWGASAGVVAKIGNRIANDERWDPENNAYLNVLLNWAKELTNSIETPDILRFYNADPARKQYLLFATQQNA